VVSVFIFFVFFLIIRLMSPSIFFLFSCNARPSLLLRIDCYHHHRLFKTTRLPFFFFFFFFYFLLFVFSRPQFGTNLILASELFRKIDAKHQARTGTLSPEAMERAMKTADIPHYMQTTGSVEIRSGIAAAMREKRPKQREAMNQKKTRLLEIMTKREAENDPALAAAKHPPPREAQLKVQIFCWVVFCWVFIFFKY
jgi:hypothetical protein